MNRAVRSTPQLHAAPTPPAAPSRPAPPRSAPQPLYQETGILVTVEVFRVGSRSYPVRELSALRTARGPQDPFAVRLLALGGGVLVAVGAGVTVSRQPADVGTATYLAMGAAAFVPVLMAMMGSRVRPRPYELWGDYRGVSTLLFRCPDERRYGQVTRALVRAREASGRAGRTWAD